MGMAATRPWKIKRETGCNLAVAGRPGVIFQFTAVKEGEADTSYGATVHTILTRGRSFNAFLRAPTRDERAALISAVSRAQLPQ
jgi:hypothetical protein